ncbi:hypothetical protein D3C75_381570 [compost metagenome]|nr:hypothetical protein R70331_05660 [Paenibacillus sp. FSL R7-0331]
MIVEIDGYFENVLLIGKTCSIIELKNMYIIVKSHCTNIMDIPAIFCRLFDFELIYEVYKEGIDFVIDTDTDHVYTPRY